MKTSHKRHKNVVSIGLNDSKVSPKMLVIKPDVYIKSHLLKLRVKRSQL